MVRSLIATAVLAGISATLALAAPLTTEKRQDPAYAGYLFTHFPLDDEAIYFSLSKGNDPLSYTALNNGSAVLRSTVGTKGLRDSYLFRDDANSKYWIVATDLNAHAGEQTPFACLRFCSPSALQSMRTSTSIA